MCGFVDRMICSCGCFDPRTLDDVRFYYVYLDPRTHIECDSAFLRYLWPNRISLASDCPFFCYRVSITDLRLMREVVR